MFKPNQLPKRPGAATTTNNTASHTNSPEKSSAIKPAGNVYDDMIKSNDGKLHALNAQNAKTSTQIISEIQHEGGILDPAQIVSILKIRRGLHIAEFGVGAGHYIIPLAKAVGDDGLVYGIDIQKGLLLKFLRESKAQHLDNVRAVWGDLESAGGSKLPDEEVDMVIAANILFQVKHKNELIREANRILKSNGRLIIIDWSSSAGLLGPKPEHLVNKESIKALCAENNFTFISDMQIDKFHFMLKFAKNPNFK